MYQVKYEDKALKQLKKLDRFQAKILINWIDANLSNCNNPRIHGKGLVGSLSSEWRYRVGNYRILAHINDDEVIIRIVRIGHRKDIYQ